MEYAQIMCLFTLGFTASAGLFPLMYNLRQCYQAILNDARIISRDPALQSNFEILYAYPGGCPEFPRGRTGMSFGAGECGFCSWLNKERLGPILYLGFICFFDLPSRSKQGSMSSCSVVRGRDVLMFAGYEPITAHPTLARRTLAAGNEVPVD